MRTRTGAGACYPSDLVPNTLMAEGGESHCSREHRAPCLSSITAAFAFDDSNVLNVYIVGSHLWGSCHKHSDWDVVVVLDKLSTPKPLNLHKSNLEAFILSLEQYSELIQAHSMQVLITLWLPAHCILREKINPRERFQLSRPTLAASLEHSKERDLRIAEKHFHKKDPKQSKKVLLHCIRYLCLGAQLASSGTISDYAAANEYRDLILGSYSTHWSDLLASTRHIIDQLQCGMQ